MSTRRTRQELIEQGLLKELPDNGESDCLLSSVGPGAGPPTYSRVKSSAHRSRNAVLPNSRCLRARF